ncbi:glycosyltransferase [Sorangium sp. So ce118]
MALIAFQMLEEPGHINPTLKLARALKARGHRVVYLEPPDFEGYIAKQGFEHQPFFEEVYPAGFVERFQAASRLTRLRWRLRHQEGEMQALRGGDVARRLERLAPDLLFVDYLNNGVALVARKLGIPCVVLNTTFQPGRDGDIPPIYTPLLPARSPLGRARVALAWQRLLLARRLGKVVVRPLNRVGLTLDPRPDWPDFMATLAAESGYPPDGLDDEMTYPIPSLTGMPEWVLAPEALDFPRPRQEGRLYVESVDEERVESADFPWDRLDPARRLVYCALGTQAFRYRHGPRVLRAIVDAVAGNPAWQLVLATGTHPRAKEIGEVPGSVVVVEHAPQLALLRRAHLMVNHGGLQSVKEALLLGVPMLCVPQAYDQPGNGARVAFHGIGRVLRPEEATRARARALLEELDGSAAVRERVRALSARFRETEQARPGLAETERRLGGGEQARRREEREGREAAARA